MKSNFEFIKELFPKLYENAIASESLIFSNPRASCFYARFTLEQAVFWLYENEPYLKFPSNDLKDNHLGVLIHETTFQDNLTPGLFPKIKLIHKLGNLAAHSDREINQNDALKIVKELFHFLYWLCRYYTTNGRNLGNLNFDESLITKTTEKPQFDIKQLQELEEKLKSTEELKRIAEEKAQKTEAELLKIQAEIDQIKQENHQVPDNHDYNEAETRTSLIDVSLKEAGWILGESCQIEYPVTGMPKSVNSSGKGNVDYVLFGDNGKPLAVIEAKRTNKNPKEGKTQAKLYADCLEEKFGERPIIFYTNGYEIYIWDDQRYPDRKIDGFLKKDELEMMIFRRNNAQNLADMNINDQIVNRDYQIEAIKTITETFALKKRKALLVMATGTGKTRTAIALIELLIKAGWVKRVLFLADRRSLVIQSANTCRKNLPNNNVVNLLDNKSDDLTGSDIIVSTYPTMLNLLDVIKGEKRFFGVGHFDLIIVDEAHRSIYRKYRYLFQYFDGLLVGLTATPRAEIDRDTYAIFDLDKNVPTFEYSLEQGIKDGYLVPPRAINVPFKFLRSGIRFDDLSDEEKIEFAEKFRDDTTGMIPGKIDGKAINQWLFNVDTIDQTISLLMQQGLKVDGGDRLGKTIIFARNHDHAVLIVERFNRNYPQYCDKFAQLIDSSEVYAQNILDDFSLKDKLPIIAVSVDMLDTGIDIPEVLNLVFFKPVYSPIKFWQMIGRGTRLCPNLFGFEQDKKDFLIFDLCGNFEFFSQKIAEKESKITASLTGRIFNNRLKLSHKLPDSGLKSAILDELNSQVLYMNENNVLVRPYLQDVEFYRQRENWNNLSSDQIEKITPLGELPTEKELGDRMAKEFDLICVNLQLTLLQQSKSFNYWQNKVQNLMDGLAEKQTIPMIKNKISLITEVRSDGWWEDVTLEMIEEIRLELREIIKFVSREQEKIIYTNFEDSLGEITEIDLSSVNSGLTDIQYKKRVEQFILSQDNNIVIGKIKRNLPLTETDLETLENLLFTAKVVENRERFEDVFGNNKGLKQLIRELVKLDREVVKSAFSKYLDGTKFKETQIKFVELIADYLTQRGVMNAEQLYEMPFTNLHYQGVEGLFNDGQVDDLINIIESFNYTVDN